MPLMTYAPLPKLRMLLKSLFGSPLSDRDLAKPWLQENQKAYWFSRSAVSLVFILDFVRKIKQKEKVTLLVPDYFCEAVLTIISNHSQIEILRCPEDNLVRQLEVLKPDLVLAVHYFGIPTPLKDLSREADRLGVFLIEDCAHVFMPSAGIGSSGDFIIYSQHKVLAIPDGALCLINEKKLAKKCQLLAWDLLYREISPKPFSSIRNWIFKKSIQKSLPLFLSKKIIKPGTFDLDTSVLPNTAPDLQSFRMSRFSKRLLALQSQEDFLSQSATRRVENAKAWIFVLSNIFKLPKTCFSFSETGPYFLVCSFDSKVIAKNYYEILKQAAVPVLTWPDLAGKNIGEAAIHRRMTRFYLPIHASISPKQIEYLFLKPYLKLPKLKKNEFELKEVGQEIWEDLFSKIKMSNLLQSYAYGEVKRVIENWGVYRYVVLKNTQPVALVQVLEKKFGLGLIKVRRINRGPLFLPCIESLREQKKVIDFLKKSLTSWQCRLFWAPELVHTERAIIQKQFQRKSKTPWISGWVDLTQGEDGLRKSLRSNWRNQLNKAENSGVVFEKIDDQIVIDSVMEGYRLMMQDRGSSKAELDLSVNLFKFLLDQKKGFLLGAFLEGVCVGSVLIVQHAKSATYLMGWNTERGKQLCVSNLLVWEGLLKAKNEWGCEFFDVGGLGHPSIADFKRGLNLTEYKLVGEYLC